MQWRDANLLLRLFLYFPELYLKAARKCHDVTSAVLFSDMAATLCVKLLPKQGNVMKIILYITACILCYYFFLNCV